MPRIPPAPLPVAPPRPPAPARPVLAAAHVALAAAVVVLVVAQAGLAGQHLFYGQGIALHGILGNTTFALTVVGVVLAVVRRLPASGFALAVALFALTFAQVGLGYVGRSSPAAAAWHIPSGVAIVALAAFQLATLLPVRGGRPDR